MNERIKQIMLEHGLHKYISEDCHHRMVMMADLIVRECADIASINQHQYDSVGNYVLKHFGIKE